MNFNKVIKPISYIMHPIFLGIYYLVYQSFTLAYGGGFVLEDSTPNQIFFHNILIYSPLLIIGQILIPFLSSKYIAKDIHLFEQKTRFWPYTLGILANIFLIICPILYFNNIYIGTVVNGSILLYVLSNTTGLIILFASNKFIKSSLHSASNLNFLVFMAAALFGRYFTGTPFWIGTGILILTTFLVCLERYLNKAHTLPEILSGLGLALLNLVLFYLGLRFLNF